MTIMDLEHIQTEDLPETWDELAVLGKECLRVRKIADLTFARVCQAMLDGPGSKTQRNVADALDCAQSVVSDAVRALSKITENRDSISDDLDESTYNDALREGRKPKSEPAPPVPHQGEGVKMFNETEARQLTEQIKESREADLIVEAEERRADAALGYKSWDRYCHAELADVEFFSDREGRREVVVLLKESGMANRAIGHALDMDEKTVRADLKTAESQVRDDEEDPSCAGPAVVYPEVKVSPLQFAREVGVILARIDSQQYGPDDLTAEQLRVLDVFRLASAEFSEVFAAEEEETIKNQE